MLQSQDAADSSTLIDNQSVSFEKTKDDRKKTNHPVDPYRPVPLPASEK